MSTVRADVLDEAARLTHKDRNKEYGDPRDNFAQTAALIEAYLGVKITSADVAVIQILLKVSRLSTSPAKLDNWVDIAGYAACGAEVSQPPVPWAPTEVNTSVSTVPAGMLQDIQ